MDLKKLVGNVANSVKDTGKKLSTEAKDSAKLIKLKMDAIEIASKGIKDLSIYYERYPQGTVVHEVVKELIDDLESRKKAVSKMSGEALQVYCVDIMDLVYNQKESNSENEATKSLENSALLKVYKSATPVYQSLSYAINALIDEYGLNK